MLEKLFKNLPLEKKYNDHQLKGNMKDFRECPVSPAWLLIYTNTEQCLYLPLFIKTQSWTNSVNMKENCEHLTARTKLSWSLPVL